jgi:hypothetical protein
MFQYWNMEDLTPVRLAVRLPPLRHRRLSPQETHVRERN